MIGGERLRKLPGLYGLQLSRRELKSQKITSRSLVSYEINTLKVAKTRHLDKLYLPILPADCVSLRFRKSVIVSDYVTLDELYLKIFCLRNLLVLLSLM